MIVSFASHVVLCEKVYTSYHLMRLQDNTTDACSSDDQNKWQSSTSANNQFYENVQTCTFQNAGSANLTESVQQCLNQTYPDLSQSCAECFSSSVDCGATNCRGVCQDSSSSSCQTCLTPCTSTLAQCTGTSNLPVAQATTTTTKASYMHYGVTFLMSVGIICLMV